MKDTILTILMLFGLINLCAQDLDLKYKLKIDLNADTKAEQIYLESLFNNDFKLKINDKELIGNIGDPVDGFMLIDINKWDKYKELAVHTAGPSDDDIYMIYWYDGKNIVPMDELSRWPKFLGNGIVYVNDWEGFWSPRDKYKLDDTTRKLVRIEQPAYYLGIKTKIKTGFKIYLDKDLKSEVALLADNSEIEILLCDMKDKDYFNYLYLIKSSSGLIGWADFRSFKDKIDLPMAD